MIKTLPNIHAESQSIDIKKSSYKKVSIFLEHYKALGLLFLNEVNGVLSVSKVDRSHQLFKVLH
jgi:hypothetical protein